MFHWPFFTWDSESQSRVKQVAPDERYLLIDEDAHLLTISPVSIVSAGKILGNIVVFINRLVKILDLDIIMIIRGTDIFIFLFVYVEKAI